jgi:hypothetical protein
MDGECYDMFPDQNTGMNIIVGLEAKDVYQNLVKQLPHCHATFERRSKHDHTKPICIRLSSNSDLVLSF